MTEKSETIALFRLMVLGPLASRKKISRGELNKLISKLSLESYEIPYSKNCYLSKKTIERWYYDWLRGGFDALHPKKRTDSGCSKIKSEVRDKIVLLKKENPCRSLDVLLYLINAQGIVAKKEISRSALHRFLQKEGLSTRTASDAPTIERRSFEAEHAGDIWHGDVLHGPSICTPKGMKKTYLVSIVDDKSRLIAHSNFCFNETALEIEGSLKQALLKRGLPKLLIVDNGAAYRAKTLKMVCARLRIRLVYCPPYEPQGKGKLERWHRTFRAQFLTELHQENINDIGDLNTRLWAWIEQFYHQQPHEGLADKMTPLACWRSELTHVQPLGPYADKLDEYFYHRIQRTVRKDGSVSWNGEFFEVPYKLCGKKIYLVVDPHENTAIKVESLEGEALGGVSKLDKKNNCHRKRQRPTEKNSKPTHADKQKTSLVEITYEKYKNQQIV